ncbi:hypothetical protein ACJX0J_041431 [Zea mays]
MRVTATVGDISLQPPVSMLLQPAAGILWENFGILVPDLILWKNFGILVSVGFDTVAPFGCRKISLGAIFMGNLEDLKHPLSANADNQLQIMLDHSHKITMFYNPSLKRCIFTLVSISIAMQQILGG